jgi:predicted amidohydrolase
MTTIRAAAVQFQHRAGDKRHNFSIMRNLFENAVRDRAQVIAFPEMCVTGYWHIPGLDRSELEALAEPIEGGPSATTLSKWAQEHGVIVGAGLLERSPDGRLFNSYVVALPDGARHTHRKLHAFEHEEISSGDRYTVFDTGLGVKIGVLICYDNNIVENARMTALLGADILLAPHQTGGCDSVSPHGMKPIDVDLWRNRDKNPAAIEAALRGPNGREWLLRWLPARAHDNGMFIVFSNGVGEDNGEVRTGNAMLIDPYGRLIAETWKAADASVIADLDLDLLPLSTGRRWMRGRRPDLYGPIAQKTGSELSPRAARFSKF